MTRISESFRLHFLDNAKNLSSEDYNGVNFTRVCGQVIGPISGNTDGLDYMNEPTKYGFEGIEITLSISGNLIWSFIAGHANGRHGCPCTNAGVRVPPAILNNPYFCSDREGLVWPRLPAHWLLRLAKRSG